jgi:hypothetical protein
MVDSILMGKSFRSVFQGNYSTRPQALGRLHACGRDEDDYLRPYLRRAFPTINGDSFNSASTPQLATIVVPARFRLARRQHNVPGTTWRESTGQLAAFLNRHSGCPIKALGHDG